MNLTKKQIPLPPERQHYVIDNLKMVHFIIQHRIGIKPYTDIYEDLYQEGVCQLIECARKYDEDSDIKFSSYAFASIQGHIRRMKRDTIDYLKLPRGHYDTLAKLHRLGDDNQYSVSELAELVGESEQRIAEIIAYRTPYHLDMQLTGKDRDTVTAGDMIATEHDGFEDKNHNCETIYWCIEKVTEYVRTDLAKGRGIENVDKYCDIWEEYIYTKIDGDKVGQWDLATKYQLAQPSVSRVLKKCMQKLKEYLAEEDIFVS